VIVGEHGFSFGVSPAEGARTISGKAPPQPKMAIDAGNDFREYLGCHTEIFPGFAGNRPAFTAGLLFLGSSVLR